MLNISIYLSIYLSNYLSSGETKSNMVLATTTGFEGMARLAECFIKQSKYLVSSSIDRLIDKIDSFCGGVHV